MYVLLPFSAWCCQLGVKNEQLDTKSLGPDFSNSKN